MIRPATVRAATVQLVGTDESQAWDLTDLLAAVREAAAQGAQLVVLPELSTTPYFCQGEAELYAGWARPVDGPEVSAVAEVSRGLGLVVVLPFFEQDPSGTRHNSVVVLDHGEAVPCVDRHGIAHPVARKVHLPADDDPVDGYDEADHFVPGDWIGVHDTGVGTLGVLVCYDRRFPETWRTMRALGADVVAVCVAGPGGDPKGFFLAELRTHARENGVYAVAANKSGDDLVAGHRLPNLGESSIHAPDGRVLAVRTSGAGVVVADLDLEGLAEVRRRITLFEERRLDVVGEPSASAVSATA